MINVPSLPGKYADRHLDVGAAAEKVFFYLWLLRETHNYTTHVSLFKRMDRHILCRYRRHDFLFAVNDITVDRWKLTQPPQQNVAWIS